MTLCKEKDIVHIVPVSNNPTVIIDLEQILKNYTKNVKTFKFFKKLATSLNFFIRFSFEDIKTIKVPQNRERNCECNMYISKTFMRGNFFFFSLQQSLSHSLWEMCLIYLGQTEQTLLPARQHREVGGDKLRINAAFLKQINY